MNNKVIDLLKKNYGQDSIIKGSQMQDWVVMPLGIPTLDYDLGGGLVVGRINMFMGKESSGKSTLCYKAVAEFQKLGIDCYYFDLDKLLQMDRAVVFGVDPEKLTVISENLDSKIVIGMMQTILKAYNEQEDRRVFIVLDSLAAMASPDTLENIERSGYNTKDATWNNHGFKLWNPTMSWDQTILIVNQYRDSLDQYGEKDIAPGGNAQKFYPPTRVEVRQGKVIKDGTVPIGQEIGWTVKKSKTSAPKITGNVDFYYATGFDTIKSLVDCAVTMELIEQKGAFYNVLDEQIRGKEKLYDMLRDKPEFLDKLWKEVYSKMNTKIWDGSSRRVKHDEV